MVYLSLFLYFSVTRRVTCSILQERYLHWVTSMRIVCLNITLVVLIFVGTSPSEQFPQERYLLDCIHRKVHNYTLRVHVSKFCITLPIKNCRKSCMPRSSAYKKMMYLFHLIISLTFLKNFSTPSYNVARDGTFPIRTL